MGVIYGGNAKLFDLDDLRNGLKAAHPGRIIFQAVIIYFVAGLLKIKAGT
jgi:hypothetical protein